MLLPRVDCSIGIFDFLEEEAPRWGLMLKNSKRNLSSISDFGSDSYVAIYWMYCAGANSPQRKEPVSADRPIRAGASFGES